MALGRGSKKDVQSSWSSLWFSVAQIFTSWLSEMVAVGALATRWG